MSKANSAATGTPPAAAAANKPPLPDIITDARFLELLDLSHPQLKAAKALQAQGNFHAAAISAAANGFARTADGKTVGCIPGSDIAATRAAIKKHFGDITAIDKKRAEYCRMPVLPEKGKSSYAEDLVYVQYARTARTRGNDALTHALLYATTGDKTYARTAIEQGLALAAHCEVGPEGDPPAAYSWHPHASEATHGHDFAHAMQYWMQVWPLIEDQITPEEKLAWVKVLVQAAYDRYRSNITEIPFNITFHPLLGALQVFTAYPVIRNAAAWTDRIVDRFEKDMCGLPCMSPDGFTREHPGYHNVNTRITTIAYLTITRGLKRKTPIIRKWLEKAYETQALFLTPDSQLWILGDTMVRATHEHWQDAHEALQLAAALFNRPDFKAQSGSRAGTKPELLNAWLMGPEGIARFAAMPAVDIHKRELKDAHAPATVAHTLRAGHGVNGHCGVLSFLSSFNHGHHDYGEALVYGYGRELLSDPGHYGYGGDHVNSTMINIHACAHVIRRTPMGPRHDWPAELVQTLGTFKSKNLSVAQGQHKCYENHIVKRALALVTPFGPDGSVFWLIHDQIDWKKGWPQGNEPMEMIDTLFPFHAPASPAQISRDGRSVWSQYAGPDGAPFREGGTSRRELAEANEISDSDANLQVTGLAVHDKSQWDFVLEESIVASTGDGRVKRPMANSHWRGYLPHARGFVMVPYKGVRDMEFAQVTGKTTPGTLSATVVLPEGTVTVELAGLEGKKSSKLTGSVKIKK